MRRVVAEVEDELEDDVTGGDSDYDLDDNGATFDLEEFKAMGINPFKSTHARPGSEEKVMMLSARYAAGLPLWHDSDCYEHGPHEDQLMGALQEAVPQIVLTSDDEDE